MTRTPVGRPGGRPVGLVVVLLAVLACAVGPVTDDGPHAPGSRSPSDRVDVPTGVEAFQQDLADAVGSAETYWSAQLRAAGQPFRPVRRIIPYQRAGEVTCAGQPLPRNNAVYCPTGDFIAYDVRWAVGAFHRIGDAFLYYLLGHEYAHAVQERLGLRHRYPIERELQADCMAGAYLGGSIRSGVLRLEDGDLAEFRRGLAAVGDTPDQPWFAEGAHGTAEQRTRAFFLGYERSLTACDLR